MITWSWPDPATDPVAVIEALELEPLPGEGGFIRVTARASELNSILFLLTDGPDGFSALHRLSVTEGWHWLAGADAEVVLLGSGTARLSAATPVIVPAGTWQGARTLGRWTLVSCWCTPAYTDDAFELAEGARLMLELPEDADLIERFTRDVR